MSELRFETAGVLGAGLVGGLFTSTRVERSGAEHYLQFRRRGEPVIFVFWHAQLLPLIHYHREEGIVVLVSDHTDGEYVTRVLERNGFRVVRGSSTRGGARGLRGMMRAAGEGRDLALTPDGPTGPPRVCKPGALTLAQVTGLPLIPMAAGASGAWRFRSWDRFMVPWPFSRIRIAYAPPLRVPVDASTQEMEALRRDLERILNGLTDHLGSDPAS